MKDVLMAACLRIAAGQHGVIGRRQAHDLGISKHGLYRLVESGAWRRLRPGVYSLWTPSLPQDLWLQRLASASLWLGDGAAVSHRAAALISDLDGVEAAPVELTTTGRRRALVPGLTVHGTMALPPEDVVLRKGLRTTSIPRTIVDLAAVVTPETLELAVESALRSGHATVDALMARLDAGPHNQRGCRALRAILGAHPSKPTESALESFVWQILRGAGLPPPHRQHEVRDERRRLVARLDYAYPEAMLAIEADGFRYHSSSRDFRRDRAKHNALTRLGWTIYRVTWNDATRRRREVAAEVAGLLQVCRRRALVGSEP